MRSTRAHPSSTTPAASPSSYGVTNTPQDLSPSLRLTGERRYHQDTWQELALAEAKRLGEPPLDPDDSERFIRLYEGMIQRGDRDAIWRFHVFGAPQRLPPGYMYPC